jgi:hypothetical protein
VSPVRRRRTACLNAARMTATTCRCAACYIIHRPAAVRVHRQTRRISTVTVARTRTVTVLVTHIRVHRDAVAKGVHGVRLIVAATAPTVTQCTLGVTAESRLTV